MARQLSTNPKTVYNREYARRKRAEKKAAMLGSNPPDIEEPHDITEDIPVIDVVSPVDKPKTSLKERLLGRVKQPSPDHKKRTKKIDNNLLQQLAPTLVSTFAATYTRQWLLDPYKLCAPSQEEMLEMVAPYFNILSRYVEITGHASENVLDLINAIIASAMYGTRAYVTYVMIKEDSKTHEYDTRNVSQFPNNAKPQVIERNPDAHTAENDRSIGNYAEQGAYAKNGTSNDQDSHSFNGGSEADRVAQLLVKDVEGRRRLGLV